ncbi:MAG: hypothetical protein ABFD07_07085 [Methanobacterium sp.]
MSSNVNSKIIKKINESDFDEAIKGFLKEILVIESNIRANRTFTQLDKKRYDTEIRRFASKYGDKKNDS